jgi:hypothetical protein
LTGIRRAFTFFAFLTIAVYPQPDQIFLAHSLSLTASLGALASTIPSLSANNRERAWLGHIFYAHRLSCHGYFYGFIKFKNRDLLPLAGAGQPHLPFGSTHERSAYAVQVSEK